MSDSRASAVLTASMTHFAFKRYRTSENSAKRVNHHIYWQSSGKRGIEGGKSCIWWLRWVVSPRVYTDVSAQEIEAM